MRKQDKDIIEAFLKLLRQRGYYIRIKDRDQWRMFSRSVQEDELVEVWENNQKK